MRVVVKILHVMEKEEEGKKEKIHQYR